MLGKAERFLVEGMGCLLDLRLPQLTLILGGQVLELGRKIVAD
jgi:hypothetical protein